MLSTGRGSGRSAARRAVLPVVVAALLLIATRMSHAQTFGAGVSPNPVSLSAGGSSVAVTVSTTTSSPSMSDPILYAFSGFPAGVSTGAPRTVNAPYAPTVFTFSAAAHVAPGSYTGMLTGTSAAGTITVPVSVMVAASGSGPLIDRITPAALAAGTQATTVRIVGRNFDAQAAITSPDPAVMVVRARVISSTLAEAVLAVRGDARAGPYRLELTNPGATPATGTGLLRVQPRSSLRAPLAVTGVRIVSPRAWQIVAEDERVYAQALLATTGMGTVTGTWTVDGVPFERFTQVVTGGLPVEIRSRMPLPLSSTGEHRLELVIENPRTIESHHVPYLQAPERRSALRLLSPADDGLLPVHDPSVRWNPLPGASGYEVELRYRPRDAEARWSTVRRRTSTTQWRPEPSLLQELQRSTVELRVRAVFPGETFADSTRWHPLTFDDALPAGGDAPPDDGERYSVAEPHEWTTLASAPTPMALIPPAHVQRAAAAEEERAAFRDRHVGAGPPRGAAATAANRHLDLTVGSTLAGHSTEGPDPPILSRLQLSATSDIQGTWLEHQLTGDFAGSHDLGDPWHGRQESRNWITTLTTVNGAIRPSVTVGFSPPSFVDRSELLTAFNSGGGVQGNITTTVGRVSFYRSARLGASDLAPEPELTAGAYELNTTDGRYLLRLSAMRADEPAFAPFISSGRGDAYGVLAIAEVSPALELTAEAASGRYRGSDDLPEADREGVAFSLAARGSASTMHYGVALSRTEQGFVNPANPGFTPASISNRTRAEVNVGSTFFDRLTASATVEHTIGGVDELFGDARTRENGASLLFGLPIGTAVAVSLGGRVHAQRGAEVADLELPALVRDQRAVDLSISERVGAITFTQAVNFQDLTDEADPWAEQRVLGLNVGAQGSLHRDLLVAATLSSVTSEGAEELGTRRDLLFSLQPSLALFAASLRITPRLALSRSRNAVQDVDLRTEHYQLAARWAAPWRMLPLSFEIAHDWRRSEQGGEQPFTTTVRGTRFTAMLNWSLTSGW